LVLLIEVLPALMNYSIPLVSCMVPPPLILGSYVKNYDNNNGYRTNRSLFVHFRVLGFHNGIATVDAMPCHFQIREFFRRLHWLVFRFP